MILVTGGAGFIGSALVWGFNEADIEDILLVDRLGTGSKWKNLCKRRYYDFLHKDELPSFLDAAGSGTQRGPAKKTFEMVFHIGACSSTTEVDADYLVENNFRYSQMLWQYCADRGIPFVYASSAATYGSGEAGFSDDPARLDSLKPINMYGYSKKMFDSWVLRQSKKPPFWAGLKFFNVYGPNEFHKGAQASVPFHLWSQINEQGRVKLFKSYREEIAHGEQQRDFIYVKDVVDVMLHLYRSHKKKSCESGIYNLGTGKARTWVDLAQACFVGAEKGKAKIDFIEMPDSLKKQYQYFTEADMRRFRQKTGFSQKFTTLEDGIADYYSRYLATDDPHL